MILDLKFTANYKQVTVMRRSGLQKEVLKLYRLFLVACKDKPQATKEIVQQTFRDNASNIKITNTQYIEYLLRRGRKQLRVLQNSDGISTWKK